MKYTPWKPEFIFQRSQCGSRWFYGNFNLGLLVDVHPRFVNIIFAFMFVEIGIGFEREPIMCQCETCGNVTLTEVPICDCEKTPTDVSVSSEDAAV